MSVTSRVADRFGRRDWVENASVKVYNALALRRAKKVGQGELLLLIPRCLSKPAIDGVLALSGKYEVPVFVATRGQLARRVIKERRPRAIVAVACERDMVSGLHDVAGRVPVLGLTMTLPAGPCKDAGLNLVQLEEFVTPENIFTEYAYFSSFSTTWLQHSKKYTLQMIDHFKLGQNSLVVEIASNDGYLLQYFVEQNIPCLGIEPAANVAKAAIEKGVQTLI
ncbi:MAG: DUF116 domain-containing protein, partial [Gemmatimonadales bacterium]